MIKAVDYSKIVEKRCSVCRIVRPASEFGKYNDPKQRINGWRYYSRCMECARAAARAYGQADRARRNDRLREWRKSNPGAAKAKDHRARVRQRYEVSAETYAAILSAQQGVCGICRCNADLVLDHDHETGRIRGGLCNPCNVRLGAVERAGGTREAARRLDPENEDAIVKHLARDALSEVPEQ